MAGRFTLNNLGGYRSELRTDVFFGSSYGITSEYYRPFTESSRWFYVPRAYTTYTLFDLYDQKDRIAQYELGYNGVGLGVGYSTDRKTEIRAGEDILWFSSSPRIDLDKIPKSSERQEVSYIQYNYLGADAAVLPRSGLNIRFTTAYHYRTEKQNKPFTQSELKTGYYFPLSKSGSLLFTAAGGTSYSTSTFKLDLQSFTLGGPFRISAYGENELLGNQYYLFQGGYQYKLRPFSPLFGEGLYGVVFAEGGKMYDNFSTIDPAQPFDGAGALIARTAIGPIYVGGSVGSSGHKKWWFGLGRVF